MVKSAQYQIHPAFGAEYSVTVSQSFVGDRVASILPYHEVYAVYFQGGDKWTYWEMTIDKPDMIEAETANWEAWNNEDKITNLNFRIHFIPKIGSDFYFVYNHLWDGYQKYNTIFNAAISKIAYQVSF